MGRAAGAGLLVPLGAPWQPSRDRSGRGEGESDAVGDRNMATPATWHREHVGAPGQRSTAVVKVLKRIAKRTVIHAAARVAPITWKWRRPGSLVVLMYHRVLPKNSPAC